GAIAAGGRVDVEVDRPGPAHRTARDVPVPDQILGGLRRQEQALSLPLPLERGVELRPQAGRLGIRGGRRCRGFDGCGTIDRHQRGTSGDTSTGRAGSPAEPMPVDVALRRWKQGDLAQDAWRGWMTVWPTSHFF